MRYKTPKHAMQATLEVLLRVLALHFCAHVFAFGVLLRAST